MSSLLASRWAAAPTEEEAAAGATESTLEHESTGAETTTKRTEDVTNKENIDPAAATFESSIDEALNEKNVEATAKVEEEPMSKVTPDDATTHQGDLALETDETAEVEVIPSEEKTFPNEEGEGEPKVSATPVIEVAEEIVEPETASPVKVMPAPIDMLRLEPPRLKKRISWRGKNCVINIPSLDYTALGLPLPMSIEEVRQRIQSFEDEGYSTAGFDGCDEIQMHNKPIYPEEVEENDRKQNYRPAVVLPDLNAWRNYMQALIEAKLAALGVSIGDDEPASAQDMSRQSSDAFAQPFSPPIPTGSAMSMGRPPFVRGHSHTMSVASPVSPMNGPFGHAHRHSTFSITPFQQQELARQAAMNGLQSFSPQPRMPQIGSPAQFNALRNDLGAYRGPGSPLTHSMTPDNSQEYNRLRQAGLIPQPSLPPNNFVPQRNVDAIPALPELPEDSDEDELSDNEPYVPPHKRAHMNEEIVVPTPRGHRHNISEGLEREVMQTEENPAKKMNGRMNGFGQAPQLFGQISDQVPFEKDPLSGDFSVQQSNHGHKKSGSRFNVAAPAFVFNPAATFQPGSASFSFPPPAGQPTAPKHTRQTSSGNFNVAAPEFKPSGSFNFSTPIAEEKTIPSSVPSSGFSFSTGGPSFKLSAPNFTPTPVERTVIDDLPSIFGKIEVPEIIKPARKSKAVSIVQPSETSGRSAPTTDVEDSEGRIIRSDERQKRTRTRGDDDGDDVPLFAEPTFVPVPTEVPVLPSQPADQSPIVEKPLPELPQDAVAEEAHNAADREAVLEPSPKHQLTSSLSALAKPWQPETSAPPEQEETQHERPASISSLEDGELVEDDVKEVPTNGFTFPQAPVHHATPSFAEIDAVMQHLNGDAEPAEPERSPSPKCKESYEPQEGVTYISGWPRSDAPSPSPRRQLARSPPPFDANAQSLEINGWPHINRLNKAQGPPSDWSDMLSPAEDHKLQARSSFFDGRVDDVIGRVLEDRLRPFEEALQSIQLSLNKNSPSMARQLPKHRSSSNIESDADDEDDSEYQLQRPISRGRDQKLGQFKAVVLEALREQSPQRQTSYDIADLHSALADMKVSFARVASTSLELDDIRAVVEEVVGRQSQALVPSSTEREVPEEHERQLAELENRLDQTLTSSLEQANRVHQVEQREAEARRMLKLAEEELRLLRDTNRDDDSRVKALEEEHNRMLEQLEEAEDAQTKAEARRESMEAENEALSATLEEYRLSSNKWRQEADQHKHERHALEKNVAALDRQIAETQDSGSGMRRRLEKLHTDLATAMGQLTSEKGRWKTREESYRSQCEALDSQATILSAENQQLEEEVRTLRAKALELDTAKYTFDGLHFSNSSLDEMVADLRGQLIEQQKLTTRYEQESNEAKEAGRVEVQRMRTTLELDIEAANHRVNLVRAELENEIAKVRADMDSVKMEADTAKERHALLLEAEADARREVLGKATQSHNDTLTEVHTKHESAVRDLTQQHQALIGNLSQQHASEIAYLTKQHETAIADVTKQHSRTLAHAIEDKERSEYLLNERLALADAKLAHFQDKVLHLEERVEVAKSAAQAAVMNVQSTRSVPSPKSSVPEKISPQALRESILVLQEQLQDRETRIETLQQKLKIEGPAKIKEQDNEITWLRELLSVRNEDLAELVNTLSKPTFDRDAVRDTAIRIRANLQMEQQEKERLGTGNDFPNQAIASLSSFATPKAAQLTSAFNKWRASMESNALKSRPSSRTRSYTPSRVSSGGKPSYGTSGLMTPPASNLRSSPSPQAQAALSAPKLASRRESQVKPINLNDVETRLQEEPAGPTTPTLLGDDNYDDDAEDRATAVEDEDLDVADSQPPAFQSLEEELTEPAGAGAEEA